VLRFLSHRVENRTKPMVGMKAIRAHNLLHQDTVNFSFQWKHWDGSTIEFHPTGWASDDPQKVHWLTEMNEPSNSGRIISPTARRWLQEHCELVAFSGPSV
jgi:hypothetical protein